MGKIIVLDECTANQIAAGEVVERPASVVKELVENSLDAGAARVSIDVQKGGVASIRVVDDGEGFFEDDALLAFERYATSKLRSSDELGRIVTLGFRGEALPSIAAVSKVKLLTRRRGAEFGRLIEVHGGRLVRNEPAGCPFGASITVSELFYNLPARYKFLKKDAAEAARISELTGRLAIGRPDVSFSFMSQNTQVLHTQGGGDPGGAIFAVLGEEIYTGLTHLGDGRLPENSTQLAEHISGYRVSGYIGNPDVARANRNFQLFYINGRLVKNQVLYSAVEQAYKTHIFNKRYPVVILYISMDAGLVDVNAHPAKTEVRFYNESELFRAVYHAVEAALRGISYNGGSTCNISHNSGAARLMGTADKNTGAHTGGAIPPSGIRSPAGAAPAMDAPSQTYSISTTDTDSRVYTDQFPATDLLSRQPVAQQADAPPHATEAPPAETPPRAAAAPPAETPPHATAAPPAEAVQMGVWDGIAPPPAADTGIISTDIFKSARLVGQIFDTYIVVEQGNELILIDQHAAHERVLFEQIKAQYIKNSVKRQMLLESVTVNLLPDELLVVRDAAPFFLKAGFFVEDFGRGTVILREVPIYLERSDVREFFLEALEIARRNIALGNDIEAADTLLDETLYDIACKAAIKGNRQLSQREAAELLRSLDTLPKPLTCPHGRPLIVNMSKREFDKRFRRV